VSATARAAAVSTKVVHAPRTDIRHRGADDITRCVLLTLAPRTCARAACRLRLPEPPCGPCGCGGWMGTRACQGNGGPCGCSACPVTPAPEPACNPVERLSNPGCSAPACGTGMISYTAGRAHAILALGSITLRKPAATPAVWLGTGDTGAGAHAAAGLLPRRRGLSAELDGQLRLPRKPRGHGPVIMPPARRYRRRRRRGGRERLSPASPSFQPQ
jgi:hypothetical protein